MKREVISEAMSKISEEYRAEALKLHDPEVISGQKHMKKKIITLALVAAITAALGATAYAALSGMTTRDAEPEETIVANLSAEDIPAVVMVDEETGETMETIIHQEEDSFVYTNITKVFTFDSFTSCEEVEFKTNYAPDGYTYNWGAPNEWSEALQGDYNMGEKSYNVNVYYASQFGPDGCIFIKDTIDSEESTQDGEFIIYKAWGTSADTGTPVLYYLKYNMTEGYVIAIATTDSMELAEHIADSIELRTTGNTVEYDEYNNVIYLCNGVG